MKIILDAMGGDNAPKALVEGAILASKEFDAEIILVGREEEILKVLQENNETSNKKISVVNATEVVTMEDDPTKSLKEKKDSSLRVALTMLANDEGDAMVCAGNTGAVLAGATLIVKRIRGIRRAALAPILPTKNGGSLLIDCGANVECSPDYLEQFAIMGSAYFSAFRENPRVALVNNGAESNKGAPLQKETYKLLEKIGNQGIINFTGNIEGRDVAINGADVLVTDGFTGNILLKTYEGVGMYIAGEVKNMFTKNIFTKIGALFVSSGLKEFKKSLDYKEIGGAPLLGIKKPVIKAHGSCDAYAVRSAIRQAIEYKNNKSIEDITNKIAIIEEKYKEN